MSSYYNRTRGPVSLSLPGGRAMAVGPKSSVVLEGSDETCESVIRAVSKKLLVRLGVTTAPTFPAVPVSTVVPVPVVVTPSVPAPVAPPVVVAAPTLVVESPSRIDHAPQASVTEPVVETQFEQTEPPKAAEPTGEEPRRRKRS